MSSSSPEATLGNLKRSALGWLGRREFSRHGMQQRIYRRFPDADAADVEEVLQWLEAQNYLNDARFGAMLIRYRVGRGQGPLRVRQALQAEKITSELMDNLLAEADIDWFAQAVDTHQRRFENRPAEDQREKARQLRFLQYRGFTAEQCYAALEEHKRRMQNDE
ncbi:MAG TPA: regulatory protein RecX [Alcanivoracaceae bacterium]|nr:regulatory protein RecX [Alcanivoracaceae bacterium]